MNAQQSIKAWFPRDIGALLSGNSAARPDLDEAWAILARQVGYDNPARELGIGRAAVVVIDQRRDEQAYLRQRVTVGFNEYSGE